jgi:hypothetical protein
MKTKFLVFLIFTGLIAIDLSCTGGFGGGGCKDVRFDVIGIDTIFPLTKNSKGQFAQLTKDSVKYDSLFYSISFTEKDMVYNSRFSFITNSYADPCPSAYTDWSIDSVKIFSINSTIKTDVTNQFSVEGYSGVKAKIDNSNPEFMRQLNSQFNYSYSKLYFNLHISPAQTNTYQFTFQFFDKKGRMFEKTSEPIVIAP